MEHVLLGKAAKFPAKGIVPSEARFDTGPNWIRNLRLLYVIAGEMKTKANFWSQNTDFICLEGTVLMSIRTRGQRVNVQRLHFIG